MQFEKENEFIPLYPLHSQLHSLKSKVLLIIYLFQPDQLIRDFARVSGFLPGFYVECQALQRVTRWNKNDKNR
jgi:hypothetical protein